MQLILIQDGPQLEYNMYFIKLVILLLMYVLALIIHPILPLFKEVRLGKSNNANAELEEPRLPKWLSWFDTPDNSLLGDENWKNTHNASHWSMLAWLYRNTLYGFKWTVLAHKVTIPVHAGNLDINHHTKTFGYLKINDGNAWQYKLVKPFLGKVLILNLGWLLDPYVKNPELKNTQPLALYSLSIRLK